VRGWISTVAVVVVAFVPVLTAEAVRAATGRASTPSPRRPGPRAGPRPSGGTPRRDAKCSMFASLSRSVPMSSPKMAATAWGTGGKVRRDSWRGRQGRRCRWRSDEDYFGQ